MFDALMIVCAMLMLNVFHPGRLLVPEGEDTVPAFVLLRKATGIAEGTDRYSGQASAFA
jgi:hypothetical protein